MSELIALGFSDTAVPRIEAAAKYLQLTHVFHKAADELYDVADEIPARMVMYSAVHISNHKDIAGEIQVIRQFFPEVFILVMVNKRIAPDEIDFVKKSGANLIVLESDMMQTIRLEYIMLQVVKAAYIPVKASDFKLGSTVKFSVYTIMPLNQKMLLAMLPGLSLSESKLQKLQEVGELYVRRKDIEAYSEYLKTYEDRSAKGIANRCRAEFYTIAYAHANLIFLILDQGVAGTFSQGKEYLEKCVKLSKNLLTTLMTIPDPWYVLDQASFGVGAADRSPMIAAMASHASFVLNSGDPDSVMMAGLFCDIGMLDLSPKCIGMLDSLEDRQKMSPEDQMVYFKHPMLSLNRLLDKKIQIPEKVREIILCTHEQADEKGFPKQLPRHKIPVESAFIYFFELVDFEFRLKLGRKRETYPDVRKRVFDQEFKLSTRFNPLFLENLKKVLEIV